MCAMSLATFKIVSNIFPITFISQNKKLSVGSDIASLDLLKILTH